MHCDVTTLSWDVMGMCCISHWVGKIKYCTWRHLMSKLLTWRRRSDANSDACIILQMPVEWCCLLATWHDKCLSSLILQEPHWGEWIMPEWDIENTGSSAVISIVKQHWPSWGLPYQCLGKIWRNSTMNLGIQPQPSSPTLNQASHMATLGQTQNQPDTPRCISPRSASTNEMVQGPFGYQDQRDWLFRFGSGIIILQGVSRRKSLAGVNIMNTAVSGYTVLPT
jgi:hypothetical protein